MVGLVVHSVCHFRNEFLSFLSQWKGCTVWFVQNSNESRNDGLSRVSRLKYVGTETVVRNSKTGEIAGMVVAFFRDLSY